MRTRHVVARANRAPRSVILSTASAVALLTAPGAFAQSAPQQQAQAQQAQVVDEIIVTGSRIVRDGYEAPTPVSVLGIAELQNMAVTTMADAVNRLPALSNSVTTKNSSAADMTGGMNNLNLRGLYPTRTLVLIDGKRVVGGTIVGTNGGSVDVNTVPTGLVSRVDVVTGGASAAYGSDALAGVVNFVFDKDFTGIKGEVQGGISTYGDNESYKVTLTGGTPFAGGRGHFLAYGEHSYDRGVLNNNRPWADEHSYSIVVNQDYGTGAGQSLSNPQYLALFDTGLANSTPGGLIVSCAGFTPVTACPLRGTMFLEGGTPAAFNFGPGYRSGNLMSGGDWRISRIDNVPMLNTRLTRANVYLRSSYDISDSVTAFAELGWAYTLNDVPSGTPYFYLGNITIQADNAFIPASTRSRMTALGITQFTMGSTMGDMRLWGNLNERILRRYVAGLEGSFTAFNSDWNWDAYYQRSTTHASARTPRNVVNANITRAQDAVLNAQGRIVCRVNNDTNPANDDPSCVPFNVMGTGVNDEAALNYVHGSGYALVYLAQDVWAATMSGEPFSVPAGPVSLALGAEYRRENVGGIASATDVARGFFSGNFTATSGGYNVKEAFLETVVPLAKDADWARSFDLNAAVRATSYSTSGYVTTWKVGATFMPADGFTVRATQSRDIRAPNNGDLYSAGRSGTGIVLDTFNNNRQSTIVTRTEGNPDLVPEKADTTGIGFVLQPDWLPGFGMSADWYNIKIDGAIVALGSQQAVDRCFAGETALCAFIERDAAGVINFVRVRPANVLAQTARGIDFEVSYAMQLADINEELDGGLTFRFMGTWVDSQKTIDGANTIEGAGVTADNAGGIASTNGVFAPKLKYMGSVTYAGAAFSSTVTVRGLAKGVYNNSAILCTSGCPVSTPNAPTFGWDNSIPAIALFDLALNYKFMDDSVEAFMVVDNLFNKDPPYVAGQVGNGYWNGYANQSHYDRIGRQFRVGVRVRY